LHDYLSKLDFLTASPDHLNLTSSTAASIEQYARKLSDDLGLNYDEINELTGNTLSTSKIVLSHHRRLERYFLFFAEGRIRLPSDTDAPVANSPSIDVTLDV
jgi:hypothetical protein